MELALAVLFGVLIGMLAMSVISTHLVDGDLYVNTSDPDYAACGITFNKGANEICKKRVVVVKVHTQK